MIFVDWKLDIDNEFNFEVSINDVYDLVMKLVVFLGKEYF